MTRGSCAGWLTRLSFGDNAGTALSRPLPRYRHCMTDRGGTHMIVSVHGVRYQVTDVARAAAFYADHLGFTLEHQQLPAFASVSLGDFTLLLSGPGASGSRLMPGGAIELFEPAR